MPGPKWDLNDCDFINDIGGNMGIDSDGHLIMDVGDNFGLDLETGELHSVFGSNSSWGSTWDDEDD